MKPERWREIPGLPHYKVSDYGRIHGPRGIRKLQGKRYPEIVIRTVRGFRQIRVHQAVMLAFVGPCPEGLEVLHADDNKQNCALSNLRYGTRSENWQDAKRNGVHWSQR